MDRLNYFAPYEHKKRWHEDQLTRAFLVILRYVPLAQVIFLDLIREEQFKREVKLRIPPLSAIDYEDIKIETQQSQIDENGGNKLISIIMTDEKWKPEGSVHHSERSARYDGLIYYQPEWILVIENKPHSSSIWEEQANPNLPPDHEIQIEPTVVVILWKDLISRLTSLLKNKLVHGAEKIVLDDFLEFINNNFPYLNPYPSFKACKDNESLLERRCRDIMRELAPDNSVRHHTGWKYCIEIPTGPVHKIALSPNKIKDKDWEIEFVMNPGDTMNQARKFFSSVVKEKFLALKEKGWSISPNLHFAYISTNLVWARSKLGLEEYLQHWLEHRDDIHQIKRDDSSDSHVFHDFFYKLLADKLITESDIKKLEDEFSATRRNSINICPGISMRFSWSKNKAQEIDSKKGAFCKAIRDKIKEAMETWDKQLEELIPANAGLCGGK